MNFQITTHYPISIFVISPCRAGLRGAWVGHRSGFRGSVETQCTWKVVWKGWSEWRLFLGMPKWNKNKPPLCSTSSSTSKSNSSSQGQTTGNSFILIYSFRIVKIWDADTLTLQASLHAHTAYITDLAVSPCNQFIVSASTDSKLIVWHWKTAALH